MQLRHDSDSDDDDEKDGDFDGDRRTKKEQEKFEKMKQKMGKALGMENVEENNRTLKVDRDGDLSPLRGNLSQQETLGNKPIIEIKLQVTVMISEKLIDSINRTKKPRMTK